MPCFWNIILVRKMYLSGVLGRWGHPFPFPWLLLLAILLASSGGQAAPGVPSASTLDPVVFIPMWFPQPQFAGYYMAREKGIYEKHGLEVTILSGGDKKNPATLFKGKGNQFAVLDLLWAMELRQQGMEIMNVGQIFQKSAIEFVVRKDSGINHPADFEGRSVAVWKNRLQAQTLGFFRKYNIKPTIYPVPEGIEFFFKRAVEACAVMHYNGYNALFNFGMDYEEMRVFKLSELGMDFPEDGIYCTVDILHRAPMLVRRFVKASLEGWQYALAHPEETVETFRIIRGRNHLKSCIPCLKWMMSGIKALIYPSDKDVSMGQLLKTDYDHAVSFLIQTGRIKNAPAYGDFFSQGE